MSTTSTIGTASRNYSTISAWLAAFAAGGWIGECYNDSEFNEAVSFSGHATSAPNFITLRAATGQSAFENSANPLRYDQAKGVGLTYATLYTSTIYVAETDVTIQKMQVRKSASGNSDMGIHTEFGSARVIIDRCLVLFSGTGTGGNNSALFLSQGTKVTNTVAISYKNAGVVLYYGNANTICANCTIVAPSDQSNASDGIKLISGTTSAPSFTNCAVFGFAASSFSGALSGDYNASDKTIPMGTHNQASKTYANQFTGTTVAAMDFRLKSGADCIDAGTADTTDIPGATDIFATSRSTWDIGAFEFVSAGTAISCDFPVLAEMGAGIAKDAAATLEFGQSLKKDASVLDETGQSGRADVVVLAEFLAGLAAQALAAIESGASTRADQVALGESGASGRAAIVAQAEFGQAMGLSITVPMEFTGSANAILLDAAVPIEWGAGQAGAAPMMVESAGAVQAVAAMLAAAGAGILLDQPISSEALAASRAALAGAVETLSGLRRDGALPAEFLLRLAGDVVARVEFDGTTVRVVIDPGRLLFGRDRRDIVRGGARRDIVHGRNRKDIVSG